MSSQWLFLAMAAAIFVSMVLLAVVCLDCRINGPPSSISQANASDVYIRNSFRVNRPPQPSIGMNHIQSPCNRPSPISPLTITRIQERHRSFTPTEDSRSEDNLPNGTDPDYINTNSETEDPNYLIVLPGDSEANSDSGHDYINLNDEVKGDQGFSGLLNNQGLQDGQDLPEESGLPDEQSLPDEQGEGEYINVEPLQPQSVPGEAETREWQVQGRGVPGEAETREWQVQDRGSIRSRSSSSSSDNSSGSEANYVNQL